MKISYLKVILFVAVSLLLIGCVSPKAVSTFHALDLNPIVQAGDYAQKVDNFVVILDKSGSMGELYKGQKKLDYAKDMVSRMNSTMPDLMLTGSLRVFGRIAVFSNNFTELQWGPAAYSTIGLDGGLSKVGFSVGDSPLNLALDAAAQDLKSAKGDVAVIIFTDANQEVMNYDAVRKAATSLKNQYGNRICIYTVQIGKDPEAKKLLEQVAQEGQCGFYTNADQIASSAGMAGFVEKVFLKKVEKVEVVEEVVVVVKPAPCPDNDGDGVCDKDDQCPNTPRGAKVDYRGCWGFHSVFFDFDKYNIKPRFYYELDAVVKVLNKNPSLKIRIEGNTDNIGTAKYNMGLSDRRAKAVMEYLVKAGIDKNRLSTIGYGFSKPIATNATPEGRALNRRVELTPLS
ncbi:MAG: OmpA family protein [Desulfobacteraceae bacterium]|nr:OmpA family protein [Desulfobacteraceae bacterium]